MASAVFIVSLIDFDLIGRLLQESSTDKTNLQKKQEIWISLEKNLDAIFHNSTKHQIPILLKLFKMNCHTIHEHQLVSKDLEAALETIHIVLLQKHQFCGGMNLLFSSNNLQNSTI